MNDNLLICGDALSAMRSLTKLPEFVRGYVGKVKLAYLDPPFNTQQSFLHYDDALEHSVWLTMMRDRLRQVEQLLSADGSVWVHCDDSEQAYLKVMMDEILGRDNFIACVVWEKASSARNDARHFSVDQDYILIYAREKASFHPNRLSRTKSADAAYKNPDNDPRGPWREIDYKCAKTVDERPNLYYPINHPFTGQEVWPRRSRVWAYGKVEHERHVREGLLWWGKSGNYTFPKLKKFRYDAPSELVPRTLWPADEVGQTRRGKQEVIALFPDIVPFATPKPERLLQRIVHIATNPGDIVLDCFLGSGTTAAVSHKMGRRWVGIERSRETLQTFIMPRLTKVVAGDDPGGITENVGWAGGSGFRILDVAPSMFEEDDGTIFLADWAVNTKLSEATAAQLGYVYDLDSPFCGRKGRSRLAVVDGLVNEGVVHLLASALPEGERLAIYGTAVDDGARAAIRQLGSGSCVRKIPSALLAAYREERRWFVPAAAAEQNVTDVVVVEGTSDGVEVTEVVTA